MTSHVFLDLDGTVTDPRDGIVRCLSHALRTLARPVPSDDVLERFIGPPLARNFETLLGTTDEALVIAAIDAYRARFATIGLYENRVYPDVPSALAALVARGLALQLVTSKPTVFARRILDHFGLSRYFAGVHGPALDDRRHTKASLLGRVLATERLVPDVAVMVGDRKDDVEAAKANGMRSIGVTWGYGSREELEGAGADHIVDSLPELLALLGADDAVQERRRDVAEDTVPLEALVLDLLEWIGARPRPYDEVLEAWRTSCPRLAVWEDATARGFVASRHEDDLGRVAVVTALGRAFLERRRSTTRS